MKKIVLIMVCFLVSVSVFASPPHPRNTRPTGKEIQDTQRPTGLYKSIMQRRASGMAKTSPLAMKASMKILVLLVEFPDLSMKPGSDKIFYEDLLETGHGLTMAEYYRKMSNGSFDLSFDVQGPVTVDQPFSYYGKNDSKGNDTNPRELVNEALTKFRDNFT